MCMLMFIVSWCGFLVLLLLSRLCMKFGSRLIGRLFE